MKKITLLAVTLLACLITHAQLLQHTFNICGFVTSTNPNTPAANATLSGYITQGNGTTLGQFSATTDSMGNYCTTNFVAAPDSSNCAYLSVNITASIPGCNVTQSYSLNYWLCNDTTILFDISGCDTTVPTCTAFINDSVSITGFLSAWGSGTPPFTYQWTNANGTIYDTTRTIYPNAYGQYCVTLTDLNGCVASACYYYGPNNCNFYVTLYLDSTPCVGPLHSLGSGLSGGTAPFSYSWSTGASGQFICDITFGQYCVTVTDSNGCAASSCYYFDTCSSAGLTGFIYQADSSDPHTIYFSDAAPVGGVGQWVWDFGDSTSSTQQNPVHTYAADGWYYVCMTVTAPNGCSATYCEYVAIGINSNPCSVVFSSSTDSILCINPPCPVSFYSYPSGSAPFSYNWSFSDGSSDTTANPLHTFAQTNGWDYACLEVIDANGCMSSYCDYVYTSGGGNTTNCQASFSGYFDDVNGTPGEIFFTDYSWSANSQVASWNWSFGDGTGSALPNPSHIYSSAGNYTICLTTTDAGGCTSSYCETWYVDPAWWGSNPWGTTSNCDAQFLATQDSTVPGMIYLVDLSYGNNLFYTWTFVSANGNINQTISTQYPFISFTQFGCFNVCLTVTDTLGNCQDSYCDSLCVDSLGNMNKVSNWGLTVIPSAMPVSLLMSAKEEMQTVATVSVFPNPANSEVSLKVSLAKAESVQIEMSDVTGRIVNSYIRNFNEGVNNFKMDLNSVPEGVYFIKLNSESLNHSEKFVKMK